LQAELRDYQLEGYEWLARLAHWGVGACLADDMGLGKTVQALALMLARAPQGPTLVIAPTSVCMNWIAEAEKFAPTLKSWPRPPRPVTCWTCARPPRRRPPAPSTAPRPCRDRRCRR